MGLEIFGILVIRDGSAGSYGCLGGSVVESRGRNIRQKSASCRGLVRLLLYDTSCCKTWGNL